MAGSPGGDLKLPNCQIATRRRADFNTLIITELCSLPASCETGGPMDKRSDDADNRNLTWQTLQPRGERWRTLGQRPVIAWFTGLSGAGKSSIAHAVDRALTKAGRHTMVLDGDNLRHGLSSDLGFTDADRVENIRRAAETARLMADAGLVVIVSLISPFRQERAMARRIAGDIPFLEIFIDTSLSVCEERDPKGLYLKARAGKIPHFTGISAPYEAPESADLAVPTEGCPIESSAAPIISRLMNCSTAKPTVDFDKKSRIFDLSPASKAA
ncbi:MAG: adenylyl-sulfate kinase [Methylobacterium organophilum]|nr:adenylyl-sulfate kinase [Methylobacterium organophilum]